jgi:hypothetical protein
MILAAPFGAQEGGARRFNERGARRSGSRAPSNREEGRLMATCRACGEPIEFILTPKGRRMPVDPGLETVIMDPTGHGDRVLIVLEDGQVMRGYRAQPGAVRTIRVRGYIPHWDTCPHAGQFRSRS